jgi:hypothetical protein
MDKSNKRNNVIYISGKLSAGNIRENTSIARKAAVKLWELGYTVICPHLNTIDFHVDCDIDYTDYIEGDLVIIDRCDAILMLPGWQESRGALVEHYYAKEKGKKIFFSIEELEDFMKPSTAIMYLGDGGFYVGDRKFLPPPNSAPCEEARKVEVT